MILQKTIIHGAFVEAKRYLSCNLSLDVTCGNYEDSFV